MSTQQAIDLLIIGVGGGLSLIALGVYILVSLMKKDTGKASK